MSKERLYIFDTTLRDGAQTQGVDFSIDDKEKIASALDNLGVDYIEGGWPGANPIDTKFFSKPKSHMISLALGTKLTIFIFYFWFADLNLVEEEVKLCFVFLPLTLFLQSSKELLFKCALIIFRTPFSFNPNWSSIASKGVRSSHAISIILSTS